MTIKDKIIYSAVLNIMLVPAAFSYDIVDSRLYKAAETLNFTGYNIAKNDEPMIDVFGENYFYKKIILNNGDITIRSIECNVKLKYGCRELLCFEHDTRCYTQHHLYCDTTRCTPLSPN